MGQSQPFRAVGSSEGFCPRCATQQCFNSTSADQGTIKLDAGTVADVPVPFPPVATAPAEADSDAPPELPAPTLGPVVAATPVLGGHGYGYGSSKTRSFGSFDQASMCTKDSVGGTGLGSRSPAERGRGRYRRPPVDWAAAASGEESAGFELLAAPDEDVVRKAGSATSIIELDEEKRKASGHLSPKHHRRKELDYKQPSHKAPRSRGSVFTVMIDRTATGGKGVGKLGLRLQKDITDSTCALVIAVDLGGLIDEWNKAHKEEEQVRVGDFVISVSGGTPGDLKALLETYRWVRFDVERR